MSKKVVKNNVENNVENYINDIFKKLNNNQKITTLEKSNKSKTIDEVTKKWNMNDKIVELFKEKIEGDNNLKGRYAKILIWILVVQLFILNIFFFLKGIGILNYTDSTFNIFITGGIAEIFVLVKMIVKYLFNDNLSDSLNIILEKNNNKFNYKNNNLKKIKSDYMRE